MELAQLKNFGKPDEIRKFDKGYDELVNIGGATVGRAVKIAWRLLQEQ